MAVGASLHRLRSLGTSAHPLRSLVEGHALTLGAALAALAVALVAVRHVAEIPWPHLGGHPGLLAAAGALSLLGYGFKAHAWRRLFALRERPQALALAAASGGAAVSGLALPGRLDDVIRIAIVRRFRDCPAGVRTLCLSLAMLGLIDTVALAPLALTASALPGHSPGMRVGLALLGGVGLVAATLVLFLPRAAASQRLLRFRLGRWLHPRTPSRRQALQAWALLSACWLTRIVGLLLLLGALGIGLSLTLVLLFLCASSAAAALPLGPGGAATQAGAGTAVLIASGVGASEAVGVAVAVQAVGILVGGSIFLVAAISRAWPPVWKPEPVREIRVSVPRRV
jgi:uncharacterized membrane protein YbhN (UPF0104 family)